MGRPRPQAHGAVRLLRAVQVTFAAGAIALVAASCGGGGTTPGVAVSQEQER